MILVLDIDGTLANVDHRLHYLEDEDWDGFLDPENVSADTPIPVAQEVLAELSDSFEAVLFLTGRPENLREVTVTWLDEYFGLAPDDTELYMRSDSDRRASAEIKAEVAEELVNTYGADQLVFLDDEPENMKALEAFGIVLEAPESWEALKTHPELAGI